MYLIWNVLQKTQLKAINYFCKTCHLTCLTGFLISLFYNWDVYKSYMVSTVNVDMKVNIFHVGQTRQKIEIFVLSEILPFYLTYSLKSSLLKIFRITKTCVEFRTGFLDWALDCMDNAIWVDNWYGQFSNENDVWWNILDIYSA